MKCQLCKNDLSIASSFFKSIDTGDGSSKVYSVIDLICTDVQCPNGKSKLPVAREARAADNRQNPKNAVACCGEPMAYIDDGGYWIPEGSNAEISPDGKTISAVCAVCKNKHTVELGSGETPKS